MSRLLRVVAAVILVLAPALLTACQSCPGKKTSEIGCLALRSQTSCCR